VGPYREPGEHGAVDDHATAPDDDAGCDGQPFVGDVERYGFDGCADDGDPRLVAPGARAQSRRRNDAGAILVRGRWLREDDDVCTEGTERLLLGGTGRS
jgi:hypothetical protein